jgi:hypothetical protein
MKYILALTILALSAQAGLWSVATGPKQTKHPIKSYQLETSGFNPRVYEFNTASGNRCIAMFSSSNESSTSSLFCFKKDK